MSLLLGLRPRRVIALAVFNGLVTASIGACPWRIVALEVFNGFVTPLLGSIPMWLCLPQGEGAPLLLPVFLHFGARFSAMF